MALVASLAGVAAPAAALPRRSESWIQVRSPHFLFFSNAGASSTRHIAQDLERLRSALSQLNPELALSSPVPTWIYVFKSTTSFEPYRLFYEGKPHEGAGYFVSHPYGNHMAISADPGGDAGRVVYHEYLHHVLANSYPDLPLWLNEGLAEYFSTFDVVNGEAKIGLPVALHVYWLRQNPLIPLPELLAIDNTSPAYNEGNRRGVFYAQSWALVHYLLNGNPARRQQTMAYLHDLVQDGRTAEGLRRTFGDLGVLERDLRTYVRIGLFAEQRAPVTEEAEAPLDVAPLPWVQVLDRLGDLLLHNGDETHAAAEEHFRAALAASPGDGPALAGLGRIAQDAGRLAEARTLFAQAVEAAPDDFFLHYLLGVSLLEPAPDPQDLPRAEAAFRRSAELRPDFAEAWGRLAQALTYEDTFPPDAAKVFETAWRLMPARLDFAFNLTIFYARSGEPGRAEELIEKVLVPHQRPDLEAKAREAVFLGRWETIETGLVTPGKLAEAAPLLAALLPQAPSPERRAALQKRLDEIRDAVEYNSFSDRYNRAIDFLNAGKDAEALTILEELAAKTKNPGQAEEARKLLEQVKAEPRRRP